MMTLQQVVETTGMSRRVIQEYEDYGLAERPTKKNKYGHKALEKTPKNTPMRIPTQQIEDTASDLICPRVYTLPQEAFDVSQHIRTLPRNQHHSAKKATEAMSLGIDLLPNQTIVDTYTKYAA